VSYLRSSAARASKRAGTLRSPRMPVWGLCRPAEDFLRSNLAAGERELPDTDRHSKVSSHTKQVERIINPPEGKAEREHKTTRTPKGVPQFAADVSTVKHPSPSLQDLSGERKEESTPVVRLSRSGPAISGVSNSESSAFAVRSQGSSHASKISRGESKTANHAGVEVAESRLRRRDHGQSTQQGLDHPVVSRLQSSVPKGMPQSSTTYANSGQRQSPQKTADPAASDLRDATQVLRSVAPSPVLIKQAELKPPGNTIHIGNVDVHIHSSPAPAARQVPRQAAPMLAISRGFAAAFGLNQG
jgi:hypothetical protein